MIKKEYLIIAFVTMVLIIDSCAKNKTADLNLNFEQIDIKTKNLKDWIIDKNVFYNASYSLDSDIVYKRKYSLKLENGDHNYKQGFAVGGFIIIDNIEAVKIIKLTGYIKTENTTSDSLGLFIGLDYPPGGIIKRLKCKSLKGTHDWKKYSLEVTLNSMPDMFTIGANLYGNGKIWVDNLRLYVDGKEVKNIPRPDYTANSKEIKWLQNHCIEIKTVEAENGFEDLQPLKEMIGNARVVALGENTHGTSDIFKLKHRLVEFLVSEMGFSIFSIESSMPETYKLNNYILHGKGDPKELIKDLHMWPWNTQEVLDMIKWMKKFNERGKGKIQFTGFDMQYYTGALENLRNFAEKNDKSLLLQIDSIITLYDKLKFDGYREFETGGNISLIRHKCEKILSYLKENSYRFSNESKYKWIIQNANIILQNIEYLYFNAYGDSYTDIRYRDECMAKNVEWIIRNNPNVKIMLWAHNSHISREKGFMGNYLSEKLGKNYFNIGFISNSGTYTAYNSGKLTSTNKLAESKPGSFEYSFHKTGISCFIIDLSQINKNDSESEWMAKKLNYRHIGSVAMEESFQFFPARINKYYNSVIFVDSTNASKCFDIN